MTSTGTTCPQSAKIEELHSGRLTADEARHLREHIAGCLVCQAAAGQLSKVRKAAFPFLLPPEAPDEIGRLAGYRVHRMLEEGGMAYVFEADDPANSRRVALKVLKPAVDDETLRKRFFQEARLAAGLEHENIVSIYQFGTDNDVPFLAMEYLYGETLQTRLDRERWLAVAEALAIAKQVARGLAAAHEAGLVHRDIKPANLWLESPPAGKKHDTETLLPGGFKRVKILDFGLVKPLDGSEGLTLKGTMLGTPSFMAPEMMRDGAPLDGRADLYGLGCVMYRMLTGRLPFDDPNQDTRAMLRTIVVHEVQPLAELEKQLPRPVAALVLQLMARDPADRPADAAAVIARVEALERGETAIPALAALVAASEPEEEEKPRGVPWGMWAGAAVVALAAVVGIILGYQRFVASHTDDSGPKKVNVK
jgi:urea transport system substrate-binding protein